MSGSRKRSSCPRRAAWLAITLLFLCAMARPGAAQPEQPSVGPQPTHPGPHEAAPPAAGSAAPGGAAAAADVAAPPPLPVAVTVLDGAGVPLAGERVELLALPAGGKSPTQRLEATTDAQGNVVFPAVKAAPGERVLARISADGVDYSSPASALLPGLRLEVRRHKTTHDPSSLRVLRLETEIDLWEESVIVGQQVLIVNRGPDTVDLRTATAGRTGNLYLPLPTGARSVTVRGPDSSAQEGRVRFAGIVRPGEDSPLRISIRYHLPVEGDPARLELPLGLPVEDALTVVPRRPTVMGRELAGVDLRIVEHNQRVFDEQRDRTGRPVWVGRGAPPAGERTLRLVIAGMPHRSAAPAVAAAVLALALLALGLLLRVRRAGGRAADRAVERADLLAELARVETDLQLHGEQASPYARRRREDLIRRLVALDAEAATS